MATEEEIKKLAHEIWEQEGRPEGKDIEHYFRAKQILEEKENARVIELPPSPTIPQMKMFWVNIDTPTKTCTMHTTDCIYTNRKRETKLKGVGILKSDGGWLSFGTFVQAEDYCKREFGPKGYTIRRDTCL